MGNGILKNAFSELGQNILRSIGLLMYNLTSLIYELIINIYKLFDILCHGRLLSNEFVVTIGNRIGLILGLFMLFKVIFSFIQVLINPDLLTDKEKGPLNILKKVLIVIVLLGITPALFDYAYKLQNILLDTSSGSNVISRLILPYTLESDSANSFGGVLSAELFLSFYDINPALEGYEDSSEHEFEGQINDCKTVRNLLRDEIVLHSNFDIGLNCLDNASYIDVDVNDKAVSHIPIIKFNYVLSLACGLFVCWVLIMYTFSVGVRIIELTFLQIISPMAIVSYLSPKKDNMFQKWGQMTIGTYIDVFVRVAIINFVVLLISLIMQSFSGPDSTFWDSVGVSGSGGVYTFAKVVIILSLLQFAKSAPELIKEFLPKSTGRYGIGKKGHEFGFGLLSRGAGVAAGAVGGAVGGLAAGSLLGGATGALRGGFGGLKNKDFKDLGKTTASGFKAQKKASRDLAQVRANGGNALGYFSANVNRALGRMTRYEQDQNVISNLDTSIGYLDAAEKEAEARVNKYSDNFSNGFYTLTQLDKLRNDQTISATDRAKYDTQYRDLFKVAKEFTESYGYDIKDGNVVFNDDEEKSIDLYSSSKGMLNQDSDGKRIKIPRDKFDEYSSWLNDIGSSNDVINSNLAAAGLGTPGADRYDKADAQKKELSSQKVHLQTSDQYAKDKANNGSK